MRRVLYASFQSHQIGSHVVNVLVRVFGQQVPVRSARVANFNIRNITRAAERLSASVLHRKNDDEVIDAIELAFDLLTVLKTDRRCYRSRVAAACPTAGKPEILKSAWDPRCARRYR